MGSRTTKPISCQELNCLARPHCLFPRPDTAEYISLKSSILPFNICFPVNICIDISSTLSSLLGIWCNIFSCFKNVNFFHRIFSENLFIKLRNTSKSMNTSYFSFFTSISNWIHTSKQYLKEFECNIKTDQIKDSCCGIC